MGSGMKIGVLGTGTVGRTLAARLTGLGHTVVVGTRDPAETRGRASPDGYGNPPFREWIDQHSTISLGTFAEAAAHGELLVNATVGSGALPALELCGEPRLRGKVLVDVSNPLDFSHGMPPTLSVCNTDSLGETIQRTFPTMRVVKTLNTVTAKVMVNPLELAEGAHSIFVSGNDTSAKAQVTDLLRSFGWQDIVDLGDITTARGTEMLLPLWLRLWGVTKTPMFSLKLVR